MSEKIYTLNPQNKKLLRDFFNTSFGYHATTIIEIRKILRARSNRGTYERLRIQYNLTMTPELIMERAMQRNREYYEARQVKTKWKEDVIEIKEPNLSKLRFALKALRGQDIVVEYIIYKADVEANGTNPDTESNTEFSYENPTTVSNRYLIKSINYVVPATVSSWWSNHIRYNWMVDSNTTIFEYYGHAGSVFIYPEKSKITTLSIVQHFKEGISNCLLLPIRDWANEKLLEAKTKPTKSRYNVILNRIDELETTYGNSGIPENAIPEICNKLQVDINIELPFCETKFIDAHSIKKRLRSFRFMNSRLNHIDLNEITNNDSYEEVTRERLFEIKTELDINKKYYTYKKDGYSISSISTLDKVYKLSNDFNQTIQDFEIKTGLNYCKIDDVDNYDLSQFIRLGTHYNETVDFQDVKKFVRKTEQVLHIDMQKAYTAFQLCKYYRGFLGKITDFRKTNKIEGVGIYKITNLKFPDNLFSSFNDKLKIYINDCSYPSPELQMLSDFGVTFDIVGGCWGVKPLHFTFDDKMINTKQDKISYFAKWVGVCDSHILEKSFFIKCDEEYFETIQQHCGTKTAKYYSNGEAKIAYAKKHNYHLGHITAFITSYQRMNFLEQLMEFDVSNIIRVCVDGIYFTKPAVIQPRQSYFSQYDEDLDIFTGEESFGNYEDYLDWKLAIDTRDGKVPATTENKPIVQLKNAFRYKTDINFNNEAGISYISQLENNNIDLFKERCHYSKELHLGEGGCGKTHMNCNDKGLQRVLFLSPSWKLAVAKKKELGINCSVWARALTDDPEKISFIKEKANVLIIDEVSMLTESQKEQFFMLYSDMKIIMCGDLGYQLPCFEGIEMTATGFDNIVKHTTDFRCKDERLKEIKNTLRQMIADKSSKTDINNWVISAFAKLDRCINVETLKTKYDINDMILCGTNEVKNFYTGLFAGKFEKEKYYVMENNRLFNNGEIVIGTQPDKCKCEVRHSFTTHSIQGETASNNLFIDSSKMFDSRMFYTAISRAKTIDQIYLIVENSSLTFKYEYAKIYKIISGNSIYIGSTINSLDRRFKEHKQSYEQFKKGRGKYMTSFPLLDDGIIEQIESFKCNDIKDLWEREKEIIQQTKCVNKTYKS